MKATKTLPALLALLLICAPALADDDEAQGEAHAAQGHLLMPVLAEGEGYAIYAYATLSTDLARIERIVEPGLIITQTAGQFDQATQILRTGTYIHATRARSWSQSRLVGLYQNDTHMVLAVYQNHGDGNPPQTPDPSPQRGGYALFGVVKETGDAYAFYNARQIRGEFPHHDHDAAPWTQLPTEVPDETLGHGLIEPTEEGFNLLGVHFRELADGGFEEVVEQQPDEAVHQARQDLIERDLLAQGEGYTIHAHIASQPERDIEQIIHRGIGITHTDTETGNQRVLVNTGTFAFPTRRLTWSASRVIGTYQTDTLLIIAHCYDRGYDHPPFAPNADTCHYSVGLFDKQTGRSVPLELPIPDHARDADRPSPWALRPLGVPIETHTHGVFEPTDDGFSVFGTHFLVNDDGSVEPVVEEDADD